MVRDQDLVECREINIVEAQRCNRGLQLIADIPTNHATVRNPKDIRVRRKPKRTHAWNRAERVRRGRADRSGDELDTGVVVNRLCQLRDIVAIVRSVNEVVGTTLESNRAVQDRVCGLEGRWMQRREGALLTRAKGRP